MKKWNSSLWTIRELGLVSTSAVQVLDCERKRRTSSIPIGLAGVCEVVLSRLKAVAALGGEACANLVGSAELLKVT